MNIIITAIGGDIAQTILKILRKEYPKASIYGTDTQREQVGRILVDEYYDLPKANDKLYLKVVEDLVKKKVVDVIIPINETEIIRWVNDVEPLSFMDKITVRSRGNSLLHCFDKYLLNKMLKNAGIKVPWSVLPGGDDIKFPCIYKHRIGSGSKSMAIIKNANDYQYYSSKFEGMFFQELLEPNDEEYTCGVYRTRMKECVVVPLKRRLMGGLTGTAEILIDDEIINYCKEVVNSLDLYGSINIQLIKSKRGPELFEINPRFSSTAGFRNHIGFQDVIWSIEELLGKPASIKNFNLNKIVGERFYRVYEEIYVSQAGRRYK